MSENLEREELLKWLWGKIAPKAPYCDIAKEDESAYNEIKKILNLAPANLTYHLKRFRDETDKFIDDNPYAPIYVDSGRGLYAVIGFRFASLDGGGDGPDEEAIVLEVE